MVAGLTNESATSKSVYFAHCTSEMIFITHLLAEEPEKLAGPLLADTYVTLLKGRNAWYGQKLAKGELNLEMGDSIKGRGMIQVWISIMLNRDKETSIVCLELNLKWLAIPMEFKKGEMRKGTEYLQINRRESYYLFQDIMASDWEHRTIW